MSNLEPDPAAQNHASSDSHKITSARKKLIAYLLVGRFAVELYIAIVLLLTQLFFTHVHWSLDLVLFLLMVLATYLSVSRIGREKSKRFKKIFWQLLSVFLGLSCIVMLVVFFMSRSIS